MYSHLGLFEAMMEREDGEDGGGGGIHQSR